MSKSRWRFLAALFAVSIAGCGGASSSTGASDAGGTMRFASIVSAQTGFPYTIDIWLPPGYATGTATHPVVYATD